MRAVRFTYIVPFSENEDFASDEDAIEAARERIEELIADEGFQCLGEVIDIDPDNTDA